MPFLAEAMRAYEEGLGTAEDIDAGARVGLNHPMGPLELADFIGLDVCLGIMRVLHDGLRAAALRAARCSRTSSRRPPRPEDRTRLLHLPALGRWSLAARSGRRDGQDHATDRRLDRGELERLGENRHAGGARERRDVRVVGVA